MVLICSIIIIFDINILNINKANPSSTEYKFQINKPQCSAIFDEIPC